MFVRDFLDIPKIPEEAKVNNRTRIAEYIRQIKAWLRTRGDPASQKLLAKLPDHDGGSRYSNWGHFLQTVIHPVCEQIKADEAMAAQVAAKTADALTKAKAKTTTTAEDELSEAHLNSDWLEEVWALLKTPQSQRGALAASQEGSSSGSAQRSIDFDATRKHLPARQRSSHSPTRTCLTRAAASSLYRGPREPRALPQPLCLPQPLAAPRVS